MRDQIGIGREIRGRSEGDQIGIGRYIRLVLGERSDWYWERSNWYWERSNWHWERDQIGIGREIRGRSNWCWKRDQIGIGRKKKFEDFLLTENI